MGLQIRCFKLQLNETEDSYTSCHVKRELGKRSRAFFFALGIACAKERLEKLLLSL